MASRARAARERRHEAEPGVSLQPRAFFGLPLGDLHRRRWAGMQRDARQGLGDLFQGVAGIADHTDGCRVMAADDGGVHVHVDERLRQRQRPVLGLDLCQPRTHDQEQVGAGQVVRDQAAAPRPTAQRERMIFGNAALARIVGHHRRAQPLGQTHQSRVGAR